MNNASVYWIHLPEHTDKLTQGYIGITTDLRRRWRDHKSKTSKSHALKNAIKKYGDYLVWEPIHTNLTYEEACKYETNYRPTDHIGWNIKEGGGNSQLPQSVRDKISKAHKGKVLTQEHRDNISNNNCMVNNPEAKAKMIRTLTGRPLKKEHSEAISKAKLGVPQPNNSGAKNGRFKPWYFIDPEGIKHEFPNTTTAEYERANNLKEDEIRSNLRTANKGKFYTIGKYKGYLFEHM